MRQIEDAVEEIVKEIQAADNISIVIKKTAVILSEDSIDITSKVVKKLNEKLKTVDVKISP